TGGSGQFDWAIPSNQTLGSDFKIKVTSTTLSNYTDQSDNNFSILAGDFSLTTQAPTSVSVTQTQVATYHVTLTPTGGFKQPITLSCSGLPAGGVCTFPPASPITPPGNNTPIDVTVTVSTTLASQPGTYNFSVQGSGGSLVHTASPGPQLVL